MEYSNKVKGYKDLEEGEVKEKNKEMEKGEVKEKNKEMEEGEVKEYVAVDKLL